MSPQANKNTIASELADDELRARRVWLLVDVVFVTWAFFGIAFRLRGYVDASNACLFQIIAYLIISKVFRKSKHYCHVMNLSLGITGFGLFWVSSADPMLSHTMFFFPISILIAAQLFGIGQSAVWLIFSLMFFSSYFVVNYGIESFWTARLDEFLLTLGTAICAFFCCQQAESAYRSKTKDLVELSKSLKKRSDDLHKLATTDSLTSLTNRFQLQNNLKQYVALANDAKKTVLFLIDMNGFKEINDTLGHPVGDEVLVEIGYRLEKHFAHRAEVARLGGDEFCVLFRDINSHQAAEAIAKNLHDLLTARYHLSEIDATLGTSVGYAICPDHATNDETLLAFADTAMYHAKKNQLATSVYDSSMTESLVQSRDLNEKLATALERNEFFLVYQPQVELRSKKIIGVEALLRWEHEGEIISPGRFIPLLEQTGQILPISKWIASEACRQQAEWRENGIDIRIAINISAVQFEDPDFFNSISSPMYEFGVCPSKLELEITEGFLINNVEQVVERLHRIKTLGIEISIDDFGTGYSSLAYLRQFPIDTLKIDRTFVKDIPDSDDGVIASSIITLAKLLKMNVLAEGVETEEQLDFLNEHHCDYYQGFYFSKPLKPNDLVALFERDAVMV